MAVGHWLAQLVSVYWLALSEVARATADTEGGAVFGLSSYSLLSLWSVVSEYVHVMLQARSKYPKD